MAIGFLLRRKKPPQAFVWLLAALAWVLGLVLYQYLVLVQQASSSSVVVVPSPASLSFTSSTSHLNAVEPQVSLGNAVPPPANNKNKNALARRMNTTALVKLEQSKQQIAPIDRSHYANFTFNGIPVTFHHNDGVSRVHCIHDKGGTNDSRDDDAWKMRSCLYHNLCLNVETHEYVLFADTSNNNDVDTRRVALGAINPRWTHRGFHMGVWKVQWAPRIVYTSPEDFPGFYALPANYLLIPFHSLAAHNIGHLLWDDFYPIFSLLRTFGLVPSPPQQQQQQKQYQLLLLRHKINETLYANCDIKPRKRQQCAHNFDRFLPLLGVDPVHFSMTQRAVLQIPAEQRKSPYVCAAQGVAGLGMLQDHGWHDHGWDGQGHRPHNLARSANFQAFGEFLVRHALANDDNKELPLPLSTTVVQVVVSTLSSRDADRRLDFALQLQYLRRALVADADPNKAATTTAPVIQIDDYSMWEYSLADQVRLARQAHIWITTCGGGVMTATFLPPGATLIVFYNPVGGLEFGPQKSRATGQLARLDWDLLNNSHLRVHWFPISTMDTPQDLELLTRLVRFEAEGIVQRNKLIE